jgi:hypothetical protein
VKGIFDRMTEFLARQWLLKNPEIVVQFEPDNGALFVSIWNPDKTKLLFKYKVPAERFGRMLDLFVSAGAEAIKWPGPGLSGGA